MTHKDLQQQENRPRRLEGTELFAENQGETGPDESDSGWVEMRPEGRGEDNIQRHSGSRELQRQGLGSMWGERGWRWKGDASRSLLLWGAGVGLLCLCD